MASSQKKALIVLIVTALAAVGTYGIYYGLSGNSSTEVEGTTASTVESTKPVEVVPEVKAEPEVNTEDKKFQHFSWFPNVYQYFKSFLVKADSKETTATKAAPATEKTTEKVAEDASDKKVATSTATEATKKQ